jgi:hypothetical protein
MHWNFRDGDAVKRGPLALFPTAPRRVASPRPPPKTSPIPSGPNPNPFPPTPLHPLRPLLFVSKVYPLSATNPPHTGRCRWLLSERRWWWSSRRCRSASGSTPRTRSWCGTTSSARSPARSTPRPRSSPRSTSASASRGISQVPDDLVCVCVFFLSFVRLTGTTLLRLVPCSSFSVTIGCFFFWVRFYSFPFFGGWLEGLG